MGSCYVCLLLCLLVFVVLNFHGICLLCVLFSLYKLLAFNHLWKLCIFYLCRRMVTSRTTQNTVLNPSKCPEAPRWSSIYKAIPKNSHTFKLYNKSLWCEVLLCPFEAQLYLRQGIEREGIKYIYVVIVLCGLAVVVYIFLMMQLMDRGLWHLGGNAPISCN